MLDLDLVGTPSILVDLFEAAAIDEGKLRRALDELRAIGWFSAGLLDNREPQAGLA